MDAYLTLDYGHAVRKSIWAHYSTAVIRIHLCLVCTKTGWLTNNVTYQLTEFPTRLLLHSKQNIKQMSIVYLSEKKHKSDLCIKLISAEK